LKKGGRSHLFLIEIKREYTQHTNAFSKEKMIIKKDTSPEKRNKFSSNRERKFRVTVDAELSECDGGNPFFGVFLPSSFFYYIGI
jgi:hypothetical protein